MGNRHRLNSAALLAVMTLTMVASWYPFRLDLPRRVVNSAVQHADGSWALDGNSRVVYPTSAATSPLMSGTPFGMSIEAIVATPGQQGPARLVSVGRDPYEAGLMLGIDHDKVVLYLPCHGAAAYSDAVWAVPFEGQRLAARLRIDRGQDGAIVTMQVNDQPALLLANRCPAGASPGLPVAAAPWALGNVYSGHRPFVGRIVRLEVVDQGGRSQDLLRAVSWEAPGVFWRLPERLYEPSGDIGDEALAALWHVASFGLLGCLLASINSLRPTTQLVATIVVLAAVLNGGKALIAGRHPAAMDFLLNVASAVVCMCLRRHFASAVIARRDSGRANPD